MNEPQVAEARTLTGRLDRQLTLLLAEKDRIERQAAKDLANVDEQIATLQKAKGTLTPEVEQSYVELRRLGFLKEL